MGKISYKHFGASSLLYNFLLRKSSNSVRPFNSVHNGKQSAGLPGYTNHSHTEQVQDICITQTDFTRQYHNFNYYLLYSVIDTYKTVKS